MKKSNTFVVEAGPAVGTPYPGATHYVCVFLAEENSTKEVFPRINCWSSDHDGLALSYLSDRLFYARYHNLDLGGAKFATLHKVDGDKLLPAFYTFEIQS